MSVEVRRKFNNGRGGASVVVTTTHLEPAGFGSVEDVVQEEHSVFLEPSECVKIALQLLETAVRPGALSVIRDLVKHNQHDDRVALSVGKI